jgi:hypothetical protein
VVFQEKHLKELLLNATSATMTQPLSSDEFCKLRFDTPLKSASALVSLYTNNSTMTNFEL